MAHYSVIDPATNLVTKVFVGRDETDLADGVDDWETYYAPQGFIVRRTSYNTYGGQHVSDGAPYRYNFAGVGFTWDETKGTDGAFIPPKPFDSWVLNEDTCLWEAPIPYPADGLAYSWDETLGDWVEIQEPSA